MLRLKATLLHRQGELAPAQAVLAEARQWAERQGALAWSLRIATSAARLAPDADSVAAARAELAAVLDRFTEGRDTADYREAVAVLDRPRRQPARKRARPS